MAGSERVVRTQDARTDDRPSPPTQPGTASRRLASREPGQSDATSVETNAVAVATLRRAVDADARIAPVPSSQRSPSRSAAPSSRIRRSDVEIRRLMSLDEWESESSLTGRRRSTAVLEIDQALLRYHGTRSASPRDRAAALHELESKVDAWFAKKAGEGKVDDDGTGDARRLASMTKLRNELASEHQKLGDLGAYEDPTDQFSDHFDVRIGARELYRRAVRLLQRHLSLTPSVRNRPQLDDWDDLYAEATRMRVDAMQLASDASADAATKGAARMARGLKRAIAGFSSIAYAHFKQPHPRATIFNFGVAMKNISAHHVAAARYPDDEAAAFLMTAQVDLVRFEGFADATEDGPESVDMSDDHAEAISLLLSAFEGSHDMLAFQGTGGKDNTGSAVAWHQAPESGTDDRSDATKGVESTMGALSEGGRSGDLTSGVNDMFASLEGLGGNAVGVYQAVATLRDESASPGDKRAAYATLAAAPLATLGNVLKFAGGAMTTQRGSTGSTASTSFGFSADGTDASTDVKMAGDFSVLFAGIINTIKKAIDSFQHFGERSDKQKEGGFRRRMEDLGSFFQKVAGTVTSLANNAKAATKLGYQIAGGGQVAKGAVDAAATDFMKHAVPGMNLAMAVLDAIHQTYKLVRIGIRRSIMSEKMEGLAATADDTEMDAMRFAHGSLVKRSVRLGINLGHALAGIVGGGLNTSGIGMAPGMVISIASTAGRLGQVAARTAKQTGRDRKAEQRRAKDEARGEEFESFAEFRLRKRIDASREGKWAMFKTKIDMAVTYNWDKASENKAEDTRTVAFEILRMNDDDIYKAIGVLNQVRAEPDAAKQLEIIETALKKRD